MRRPVTPNLMRTHDGRGTFPFDQPLRVPDRPLPRPDAAAIWALLPKITCPTLLVRGAESDILSPETAQRMLKTIPKLRMVEVPNAGHSIPLENPQGFLKAVQTFL